MARLKSFEGASFRAAGIDRIVMVVANRGDIAHVVDVNALGSTWVP